MCACFSSVPWYFKAKHNGEDFLLNMSYCGILIRERPLLRQLMHYSMHCITIESYRLAFIFITFLASFEKDYSARLLMQLSFENKVLLFTTSLICLLNANTLEQFQFHRIGSGNKLALENSNVLGMLITINNIYSFLAVLR